MGEEGVVPDQGFEVFPESLILVEHIKGQAGRLDEFFDVGDRVEEAAHIVGDVNLAQDVFDLLLSSLEPEVADLEGDPLLKLLDDAAVNRALDLPDFR